VSVCLSVLERVCVCVCVSVSVCVLCLLVISSISYGAPKVHLCAHISVPGAQVLQCLPCGSGV